jgi:predicted ATP-grasp superfamily ATP-dependent carboligase
LHESCDDLLIQEIIEGDDDQHYSYCAYRTPDRGELLSICINKIRINPIHGGSGTFLHAVDNPELESLGSEALEKLSYVGVGSVCFKRDAVSGRPLIHEINGRLPNWHSIFQLCDMDLPYVMYRDIIGEPVAVPLQFRKEGSWVCLDRDLSAFVEYRRCGELGLWQWLASYRGRTTCAEFAWDDLKPFGYFARQLLAKGMMNMRNGLARSEARVGLAHQQRTLR